MTHTVSRNVVGRKRGGVKKKKKEKGKKRKKNEKNCEVRRCVT